MYVKNGDPFGVGRDVDRADLMIRLKHSRNGFHYGTGISGNLVAHKTPELGKHPGTVDEFCAALPCWRVRYERTPLEKMKVGQVAVSDFGSAWSPLANCEHDATLAQFGVAYSPTVEKVLGLGIIALLAGIAIARRDN